MTLGGGGGVRQGGKTGRTERAGQAASLLVDERQQHGVTLIEWPEHLEGLGAEGAAVLGIHLATTADEGTRSATIRGARAELLAALDTALGTSWSARG